MAMTQTIYALGHIFSFRQKACSYCSQTARLGSYRRHHVPVCEALANMRSEIPVAQQLHYLPEMKSFAAKHEAHPILAQIF
jgi:hypothetical protein